MQATIEKKFISFSMVMKKAPREGYVARMLPSVYMADGQAYLTHCDCITTPPQMHVYQHLCAPP